MTPPPDENNTNFNITNITMTPPPDKNDKLNALAQALVPFLTPYIEETVAKFLDASKNETPTAKHPTKRPAPLEHSLYLPEVDMFIHAGVLNGDFRRCGFSRTGKLNLEALPRGVNPVGLFVEGSNNDALQYYVVPCPSLKKWVNVPYDVKYTWDYRVYKESYSRYMAGVIDAARDNAPAKNNLRVRDIGWRDSNGLTPLPQAIIDNTRAYWDTMPEDGGSHIVTKATMMEVLDKFEAGLLIPGQVPWRIDVTQTGVHIERSMYSVETTDLYQPIKISLMKGV